ncbi:hypothetical protein EMQ25_15475 [Arsenicitalea aurantiaca]|uniref:Uncharacterized protein n=1 Tax=Arsenicitalea aurantiaca TaxID=1783274 RepID=A0A433X3Z2_9HYPH|nr:hypothetical protein [Arsenicitalea aurantiaca]RUT28787.1 hypothetical protein EMQ25_15475 [Arsenicitalea aurantiaca]
MPMLLILIASLLTALPALAQERYDNARFGYGVSVPSGFAMVSEGQNGDGRVYRSQDGRIELIVWGNRLLADFETELAERIGADSAEGVVFDSRIETPGWAMWSGTRAGHVIVQRTILACGGEAAAHLRLQYGVADRARLDSLAETTARSLVAPGPCL